jgi:hypothetical protein
VCCAHEQACPPTGRDRDAPTNKRPSRGKCAHKQAAYGEHEGITTSVACLSHEGSRELRLLSLASPWRARGNYDFCRLPLSDAPTKRRLLESSRITTTVACLSLTRPQTGDNNIHQESSIGPSRMMKGNPITTQRNFQYIC